MTRKFILYMTFLLCCLIPIYWNAELYQLFSLSKATLLNVGACFLFSIFIILNGKIKKTTFLLPLIIYTLLYILSTIYSVHDTASYFGMWGRNSGLGSWLSTFAIYIIISSLSEDGDLPIYSLLITTSVLIGSIWSIFHGFGYTPFSPVTGNTNTLGNLLLLGLPFSAYTAYLYRRYLVVWVIPLIVLYGIYLSQSRAVWVSTALVFLIFTLRYLTRRGKILVISSTLLILIGIVSYSYISKTNNRFLRAFRYTETTRYYLAKESLQVIKEYPFLGPGPSTYRIVGSQHITPDHAKEERVRYYDSVHNIYLDVASSRGIISLIVFLFIMFTFFRKKGDNPFIVVLRYSMIGYCIVGIFSFDCISTGHLWVSSLALTSCLK